LVDDVRQLEVGVDRVDRKGHEQDGRHAQTGALDLDAAKRIADGRDHEQQEQRISD
jgi:hypothetical protein